jgi:hypothetical protein
MYASNSKVNLSFYEYLAKIHRCSPGGSITPRLVDLFYCGGLGGEESRLTFGAGVMDRLCGFVKEKTDFTCSGKCLLLR